MCLYIYICIVYASENCGQRVSELNSKRRWTTFSSNDLCHRQVRQVGGWTFVPSLYLDSWRWDGGLLGQQSGLWTVSWSPIFGGGALGGLKRVLKRWWLGSLKTPWPFGFYLLIDLAWFFFQTPVFLLSFGPKTRTAFHRCYSLARFLPALQCGNSSSDSSSSSDCP